MRIKQLQLVRLIYMHLLREYGNNGGLVYKGVKEKVPGIKWYRESFSKGICNTVPTYEDLDCDVWTSEPGNSLQQISQKFNDLNIVQGRKLKLFERLPSGKLTTESGVEKYQIQRLHGPVALQFNPGLEDFLRKMNMEFQSSGKKIVKALSSLISLNGQITS